MKSIRKRLGVYTLIAFLSVGIAVVPVTYTGCTKKPVTTVPPSGDATVDANSEEGQLRFFYTQLERIGTALDSTIDVKRSLYTHQMITKEVSNQISQVILKALIVTKNVKVATDSYDNYSSHKAQLREFVLQIISSINDVVNAVVSIGSKQAQETLHNAIQQALNIANALLTKTA